MNILIEMINDKNDEFDKDGKIITPRELNAFFMVMPPKINFNDIR